MLQLRVFGAAEALEAVGHELDAGGTVRSIALMESLRPGNAVLTAEVTSGAADAVLAVLAESGVPEDDGVAGMLAVETRASAAVGVGISITTIPAAAYLGVAAGDRELAKVLGALGVLGVNIAMLLIGGVATLLLQRRLARFRGRAGAGSPAAARGRGAARSRQAAVPPRR